MISPEVFYEYMHKGVMIGRQGGVYTSCQEFCRGTPPHGHDFDQNRMLFVKRMGAILWMTRDLEK